MSHTHKSNTLYRYMLLTAGVAVLVLVTLTVANSSQKTQVDTLPVMATQGQSGEDGFLEIPPRSLKDDRPIQDGEHVLFISPILRTSGTSIVSPMHESGIELASQPAEQANHPHVGIVAGHLGNDSGAVCPDGLTEQAVNLDIARRVRKILKAYNYRVDLLEEFDPRLNGYSADALVSVHADSCLFINELATGFKVARSAASYVPNTEDRLVSCLSEKYSASTNLGFHENSITPDMTSYHTFREVAPETPAVIIETGFLFLDRSILVDQPDRVARGIAKGVICFIESQ